MHSMKKKVLVTGGAGFIGSNLVQRCLEEGWTVDIVDDLSNGHIRFVPEELRDANLMLTDFSDEVVLEKVKSGSYDVVFHLAAQPRVSYSVECPFDTNETNVSKTLKLMEACRDNVTRFVFASSSAIYGNVETLPSKESDVTNVQSPYGLQKKIIEDYLKLFWTLYGLDSACLRFFNVFGKNQLGDSPYSTAVSAWITAIMKGDSMRSDGDGTQSRDMVHVDNVVHALTLAAKHVGPLKGEMFNVGTGESYTNNEILDRLKAKFPEAKSHSAPARVGDVKHTLADLSKIDYHLGYEPVVRFWDGLDATIKWAEENLDLFTSPEGE